MFEKESALSVQSALNGHGKQSLQLTLHRQVGVYHETEIPFVSFGD